MAVELSISYKHKLTWKLSKHFLHYTFLLQLPSGSSQTWWRLPGNLRAFDSTEGQNLEMIDKTLRMSTKSREITIMFLSFQTDRSGQTVYRNDPKFSDS